MICKWEWNRLFANVKVKIVCPHVLWMYVHLYGRVKNREKAYFRWQVGKSLNRLAQWWQTLGKQFRQLTTDLRSDCILLYNWYMCLLSNCTSCLLTGNGLVAEGHVSLRTSSPTDQQQPGTGPRAEEIFKSVRGGMFFGEIFERTFWLSRTSGQVRVSEFWMQLVSRRTWEWWKNK